MSIRILILFPIPTGSGVQVPTADAIRIALLRLPRRGLEDGRVAPDVLGSGDAVFSAGGFFLA